MVTKRAFLWTLIISLSSVALAGIVAIIAGGLHSSVDEEIFVTLLTVSFFSLTSLGASIILERNRWRVGMIVALTISGVGLVLYMLVIWGVFNLNYPYPWYSDWVWQMMWLIGIWSVALPHAGLLSLVQITSGSWRWVRFASLQTVFVFAMTLSVAIVFGIENAIMIQCIGVLGILTALGSIGLPILGKVYKIDKLDQTESTPLSLKIVCPRCLLDQTVSNGHSRCGRCRLKFHIEIEEPRCPGCNYLLHRVTSAKCPECGRALSAEEVPVLDVGSVSAEAQDGD